MIDKKAPVTNVDQYIAGFPIDTRMLLEQIRAIILQAAPEAEEVISYQMHAYRYHGILVYFAGYAKHIGFYPGPGGIAHFKEEISGYKNAKGSVQFPLDRPLPVRLIANMVAFRMEENRAKEAAKAKKKK
jgi:uncharacterized protein YdhG (YjbR/CyaY superfamily)